MAAPPVILNPTPAKLLCRSIILVVVLILTSCGINNIPIFEQAVNEAWIEVQSQYRRRAELVMELMADIEPLRASEPELFTALEAIETRVFEMHIAPDTLEDAGAFANFEQQQSTLSRVLNVVLDTADSLPAIAQEQQYLSLREMLTENSQQIDVARRDYWQKVERYNSELVNVPGRWWRAFVYPQALPKENFDDPEITVN